MVGGMGFGISFLYCFFAMNFFNLISLLVNFISSRDMKYFLVLFYFCFFEWKNSPTLFISNLSFNLKFSPSFFFCFIHYTGDWKVPRMGPFFSLFSFRVCFWWINTSAKFDNRHACMEFFCFFSFNFLFLLWQTQAPNFITIPGSGSLQFLLNQQASQLVWWGQGRIHTRGI